MRLGSSPAVRVLRDRRLSVCTDPPTQSVLVVNACVRIAAGRKVTTEHREYCDYVGGSARTGGLADRGRTARHVAMEASGVYWKPVWHVLEDEESFTLVLANAQHIRNVPGRKSDRNDAAWIADLLAHGLILGSVRASGPDPGTARPARPRAARPATSWASAAGRSWRRSSRGDQLA